MESEWVLEGLNITVSYAHTLLGVSGQAVGAVLCQKRRGLSNMVNIHPMKIRREMTTLRVKVFAQLGPVEHRNKVAEVLPRRS